MTRKLYIAQDGPGEIIGIVLADSEAIATAYFIGRGEHPHSMRCIDPADQTLGASGLVIVFKTVRQRVFNADPRIKAEHVRVQDRT